MGGIVRKCRLCHKPMEASPFTLCKTCLVERELVRSYVMKHPKISVAEISQETGVTREHVKRMIRMSNSRKIEGRAIQKTEN